MNADDLIALLGKTVTSAPLRELFAKFGVQAPTMGPQDIDARIALRDVGITLVFQPDEDADGKPLQLVDIQLHHGGERDFQTFGGVLPEGIAFADSRTAARDKIGKPDGADDDLDTDAWDFENYSLVLEYSAGRSSIRIVHLQMAYEGDDDAGGVESSRELI